MVRLYITSIRTNTNIINITDKDAEGAMRKRQERYAKIPKRKTTNWSITNLVNVNIEAMEKRKNDIIEKVCKIRQEARRNERKEAKSQNRTLNQQMDNESILPSTQDEVNNHLISLQNGERANRIIGTRHQKRQKLALPSCTPAMTSKNRQLIRQIPTYPKPTATVTSGQLVQSKQSDLPYDDDEDFDDLFTPNFFDEYKEKEAKQAQDKPSKRFTNNINEGT